jgi:hypothetical protein
MLWGPGIILELDPYSGFRTGLLTARVLVTCDVLVTHPAAFSISTSIT